MEAYIVSLVIFGCIYLLLALGLNLQYGFTGLMNFGIVGFYALGAYASALLSLKGFPIYVGFVGALVVGAVASVPLALLSLRVSDDYLAVLTLGFAEVVRLVLVNEGWLTRGTQGLPNIPQPFGALSGPSQTIAYLVLLLAANAVVMWMLTKIVRSPFGRTIAAIRDDELAVKAVGKDPARFKTQVFMIGSALCSLAGAFQAHYLTYISPEQFIAVLTFNVWITVLIGGVGRLSGAVLGTLFLVLLLEGSRFARDLVPMVSETQLASLRLMVIGAMIIGFTIYRPGGLLGARSQ